ncbi:DUF1853 family protein [Pseudomonas sp. 8Z]|uniref:DUF1853 family protein n=1 Tax=Pseudomonas sp. 8Z TaxID=2653166 RepID=UPI0021157A04|nr:DUF1853 family protein [Pseudomonas sp. 8Z]
MILNTPLQNARTPAVRDLIWTLLSPPLLAATAKAQRHPLQASIWQREPERLHAWLLQQEQSPAALLSWLTHKPLHRLGLYYERLWQFALHAAPDLEVVAANLPLRQNGKTLGEMDLLLRDAEGEHHLELAVKFYLGPRTADGADTTHWLGPNGHDRLDLKLAHLTRQQLPLSSRREARSTLRLLHMEQPAAAFWMSGYLFQPWPQGCTPPRGASDAHLRGHWLYRRDWADFAAQHPGACWQPLPRLAWLARARVEASERWPEENVQQWLHAQPEHAKTQLLVRLEEDQTGDWLEVQRLFVLNDQWPEV